MLGQTNSAWRLLAHYMRHSLEKQDFCWLLNSLAVVVVVGIVVGLRGNNHAPASVDIADLLNLHKCSLSVVVVGLASLSLLSQQLYQ